MVQATDGAPDQGDFGSRLVPLERAVTESRSSGRRGPNESAEQESSHDGAGLAPQV